MKIYNEFFVLAFIFSGLLKTSTVILRLKDEKNILDIAAIVVSVVLLIGALSISYKSVVTKMKI